MKDQILNPTQRQKENSVSISKSAQEKASQFLKEASQFQLGSLPTESRHPKTTRLSQLSQTDLKSALKVFAEVDKAAIASVLEILPELEEMTSTIRSVLNSGGRIFFCGCGATGRLSISIETLWREEVRRLGRHDLAERVFSFIAGGDFALVRSIENFEDHPEFGVRQLHDLGFKKNDLLISCTEGGETPFVIGATEEAAKYSSIKPYFLFCNPSELLVKTTERSRKVIENPNVKSLSVRTGPMALSGSTRLQATTAQQLAVGSAVFSAITPGLKPGTIIEEFISTQENTDWSALSPLVSQEAEIYSRHDFCVHQTTRYGITVLTDTTERTPTFSLLPFESPLDSGVSPSWTYLSIPDLRNSSEAWMKVLGRLPRPINWEEYRELYGMERTLGYDFSAMTLQRRRLLVGEERVNVFRISDEGSKVVFSLNGTEVKFERPQHLLCEHLLVKCALNMTSTLVMGRLGRFLGNVMVYVRPTNKKLIDRSIRYIRLLLEDEGLLQKSYEEVCYALFEVFEGSAPDEPVVMKTFEKLKRG